MPPARANASEPVGIVELVVGSKSSAEERIPVAFSPPVTRTRPSERRVALALKRGAPRRPATRQAPVLASQRSIKPYERWS